MSKPTTNRGYIDAGAYFDDPDNVTPPDTSHNDYDKGVDAYTLQKIKSMADDLAAEMDTKKMQDTVEAAGATPADSDVAAWANDSLGIVVGTGGRVFLAFKNASDVFYVELTALG